MCKTLTSFSPPPRWSDRASTGFLRASGPCEPCGCWRDASARSGDVTRTESWFEDLISLFPPPCAGEWLVEGHASTRPTWPRCGSAVSSFAARSNQRPVHVKKSSATPRGGGGRGLRYARPRAAIAMAHGVDHPAAGAILAHLAAVGCPAPRTAAAQIHRATTRHWRHRWGCPDTGGAEETSGIGNAR